MLRVKCNSVIRFLVGFFFFFFGHAYSMCDLSSSIWLIELSPLQCKQRVLTTGPPAKSSGFSCKDLATLSLSPCLAMIMSWLLPSWAVWLTSLRSHLGLPIQPCYLRISFHPDPTHPGPAQGAHSEDQQLKEKQKGDEGRQCQWHPVVPGESLRQA